MAIHFQSHALSAGSKEGAAGGLLLAISGALFVIAAAVWAQIVLWGGHPGHGDAAFYAGMAREIAQNGSFDSNYIWHFLAQPEEIRHYAFDYWLPGTSLLQAAAIWLLAPLGVPVLVAVHVPATLVALAAGVIGRMVALRFVDGPQEALAAGLALSSAAFAVFMFFPLEAVPFIALLYTGALALAVHGVRSGRIVPLAAAFGLAGISYWFRGDALILMPFLAVVLLWGLRRGLVGYGSLAVALLAYAAAFAPLAALNLGLGGFVRPPSSATIVLTEFNDLFEYDLAGYRLELSSIAEILADRAGGLVQNALFYLSSSRIIALFVPLIVLAYILVERPAGRETHDTVFVALALLVGYYTLFYSLVLPFFDTAMMKTTMGPIALLVWLGSLRLGDFLRSPRTGLAVMLSFVALYVGIASMVALQRNGNTFYNARYEPLCAAVIGMAEDTPPVVMTREVWEFNYSCPTVPMVQVPSGADGEIGRVIEAYSVDLLLLEEDWITRRPVLAPFYGEDGFVLDGWQFTRQQDVVPGVALYAIDPA